MKVSLSCKQVKLKLTWKTLITVPFSEAVATFVPLGLNARAANGLSCAGIIVFACCKRERERQSS